MCCCAGKTNDTSALLLPDGWWTFPTPSLEPDLHRHGHPAHPRSLGLQIQQSNLPSVSCLLTCLCLELPCGAVSPHSWARGWLWGALGFCRHELEPPDLQTARWVSWWAGEAGMVALGIHWVLDKKFSCFTSDCYHWTLRTLEHKSWTSGDGITSSHTLIYNNVYSSPSSFEDISIYLFSHFTSDINSSAAAAAKRMIQFIDPMKNDLMHYLR